MTKNEYFIASSNGRTQLHCVEWLPEGEPKCIVQVAHGISCHVLRYEPLAEYLCAHGYLVAGHDHLGHGQSVQREEDKLFFGETRGWDMAVEDMRSLTMQLHEKYPGVPLVLLGHSMGSFLARNYAIRFQDGIDALVLSGTGQQPNAMLKAGIALCDLEIRRHGPRCFSKTINNIAFGAYNRAFAPNRTEYDWLSRDEHAVDVYLADESCGGMATVGLYRDMLSGILYIGKPENIARMNKSLPVYFFSGDKDPVGENGDGVIRAYRGFLDAGMEDVTLKLYAGGRHEMLNEINRLQVCADLRSWIESKLA